MQTNNKDSRVSYTETEICANCGAWKGLHHYETMQCPKNGKEETRFDELSGKFYPQQWEQTTFLDSGKKILEDAAPDLLEALRELLDQFEKVVDPKYTLDNWLIRDARNAIKKATEQ